MNKYDELLGKLKVIESQIAVLREEEENKKEDWRDTSDLLVLRCIDNKTVELTSNYRDWYKAKGNEHPLYMEMYDSRNTTVSVGFDVEQMIKLRDYLNQKIEFLSE